MNLRIFAKDATIYALGNIGLRMSALVLMPIYAHFLSVNDFGLWATLQITIQVMMIPMNLGMREAFVRYTAQYDRENRLHALFGTTILVVAASGVAVTLASVAFLIPVFRTVLHRDAVSDLVVLTGAAALAQVLNINAMAYYRARNLALRYLVVGLGGAVVLLVVTLAFLWKGAPEVQTVLYAFITSYVITTTIVGIDIVASTGFGVDASSLRELLRFGGPLVISSTGQFAITGATVYLVSYFAGLEAVALYAVGYKFAVVLAIVVVLPFQLAFQPFVFTHLDHPDVRRMTGRIFTYLVLLLTFASFLVIVGSRLFLEVAFPKAYSGALLAVVFLIPGQVLLGGHYFAETLLGAALKTHVLAALNLVAAAVSITGCVWLIPAFGWRGAVAASTASMLLVCATEVSIGVRAFHLGPYLEWRRLAAAGALFVASLGVAIALSEAGSVAFYAISAAWVLGSVALLYAGPFCHDTERQLVRGATERLYARLNVKASRP